MTDFDYLSLRNGLANMEAERTAALGPPIEAIDEFYCTAKLADGYESVLKVWRSKHIPTSGRPVIVLWHGGSHVSGSVEMETRPGRDFAVEFNALVVSGTYRLAPEHTFPASFNDGWQLVSWLTEGGAKNLGGNLLAGFILGGHSAGGHIAAVVSQLALKHKLDPPVTGTYVGIPELLDEEILPEKYKHLWHSRAKYGTSGIEGAHRLYKPDVKSPMYSPFNAKNAFIGQCRTYVQVCELDPLRDDGVVYEAVLKDRGVPVKLDITPDADHQTFCVICDPKIDSEDLKENTMAGMRWLLDFS